MAAVRAEGVVIDVEAVGLSDGGGLLSHGEVGGSGVVVLDTVVLAVELELVDDGLEGAQGDHVVVDGDQLLRAVELLLLVGGLVVGADGDGREHDLALPEQFFGEYLEALRHGLGFLCAGVVCGRGEGHWD